MSKKKIIAMIISVVMVFSLIPTAVFAIQADEWVTGQGYGSITPNSDGTYTFQGDSELNTDNSHSGPYTKANAASLADGEILMCHRCCDRTICNTISFDRCCRYIPCSTMAFKYTRFSNLSLFMKCS